VTQYSHPPRPPIACASLTVKVSLNKVLESFEAALAYDVDAWAMQMRAQTSLGIPKLSGCPNRLGCLGRQVLAQTSLGVPNQSRQSKRFRLAPSCPNRSRLSKPSRLSRQALAQTSLGVPNQSRQSKRFRLSRVALLAVPTGPGCPNRLGCPGRQVLAQTSLGVPNQSRQSK
jgi:hypothetical protein